MFRLLISCLYLLLPAMGLSESTYLGTIFISGDHQDAVAVDVISDIDSSSPSLSIAADLAYSRKISDQIATDNAQQARDQYERSLIEGGHPAQPRLSPSEIIARDRAEAAVAERTKQSIELRRTDPNNLDRRLDTESRRYNAINYYLSKTNVNNRIIRSSFLSMADRTLKLANQASSFVDRKIFIGMTSELLDGVVGIAFGLPIDLYQSVTGRHYRTGEELSMTDRILSMAGVISGGLGSSTIRVAQMAGKVSKQVLGNTTLASKISDEFIDVANSAKDAITAIGPSKFGEVLKTPKGLRPLPETYLPKEYIERHLAKFDNGASYLVPKDTLDTFGRDILGYPDNTQFVIPKGQMDNLLSRTGKDISKIENELGLDAGSWQGKSIVRIDVPNPKELNVRIPSGNERGANPNWLPGGKLPNGNNEAVINNIPKGKYIEKDL